MPRSRSARSRPVSAPSESRESRAGALPQPSESFGLKSYFGNQVEVVGDLFHRRALLSQFTLEASARRTSCGNGCGSGCYIEQMESGDPKASRDWGSVRRGESCGKRRPVVRKQKNAELTTLRGVTPQSVTTAHAHPSVCATALLGETAFRPNSSH